MQAILSVPDEVVIGFFSAVILGLATAVAVLWKQSKDCNADNLRSLKKIKDKKKDKS